LASVSLPGRLCVALVLVLSCAACSTNDLPLIGKPAASFDGHSISVADYQTRLKLYQKLYDTQRKTSASPQPTLDSPAGRKSELSLEDRAVRDLVDEQLVRDDADRNKVSISDAEVQTEVDNFRKQVKTEADFQKFLNDYGYTLDLIKQQIRARLIEVKLENKLATARTDQALASLQKGTAFADVAKQLSDDASSKDKGGEIKLTADNLANLDTAVKPAIDAMQPGDTSKQAIRGVNGFYIFKLVSRDAAGLTLDVVYINAPDKDHYRLTARPDWFTAHITDLEGKAHIKYYVGSHAA
jgi:parvulin-like peptidyl-prolyl isomerase